ncbi:MAG: asparaginase [Candidatus Fimivivens sp.]
MKKKLLLLTTGGTIASTPSKDGLRPTASGAGLLDLVGPLPYEVTIHDLLTLDSSNVQPEEWQLIARTLFEQRDNFDGIVITHGTDTMAYTASMLSFMLPGIDLPVVLTGSQLPIFNPLSDGPDNLRTAFAMAASGAAGIFVAFDRKVLLGCRAVKIRTTGFDAFDSVNLPAVAQVSSDGLVLNPTLLPTQSATCTLSDQVDSRVALFKLIPGLDPRFLKALPQLDCRGVVLEAFGSGGLAFLRRDLVTALEYLVECGVAVVVCSQCLYERSDMTTYEVGRRALDKGVIPGGDMTSEAAVTKLMWALANTASPKAVSALFAQNLTGEISLR